MREYLCLQDHGVESFPCSGSRVTSVWRAWSGLRPTWRIPSSRHDDHDDDDVVVDDDDYVDGNDDDNDDVPLPGRSYTLLRTGLVH